jgi:predicted ATP-grasp superfamily ATP-dependent carboligase
VRFFVYEYFSSGVDSTLPASLRVEGWAMLRAVAEDLARLPGANVRALLPPRLNAPCGCLAERIGPDGEEQAIRRLTRWADYSLIIAPEFDDILWTRCRWVEEEHGRLLGPSSDAVAIAADKLELARRLRQLGVPVPGCVPYSENASLPFPQVCKPRFGAGSQSVFLLRSDSERARCAAPARAEGCEGELLLQRFVPGQAASIAFLIGPKQTLALPPATQTLSDDGRFRYLGGSVPLPPPLSERALRAARPALDAVPCLRGYVGVDVVLGESDWVIEINPRLTTSYLGLRALAESNLAEAMVGLMHDEEIGSLRWRGGALSFEPDGRIV